MNSQLSETVAGRVSMPSSLGKMGSHPPPEGCEHPFEERDGCVLVGENSAPTKNEELRYLCTGHRRSSPPNTANSNLSQIRVRGPH